MAGATILGGVAGTSLTAAERDFFRAADPWGFILFARNIATPDTVRRLCADLRETVGRDALICVDQEGGRVQRLRGPYWTEWPAPLAGAGDGARAVWLRHRLMGEELRALGIDGDCAPCLDIAGPQTHPFLHDRCLGHDPETVARLGRAAADGLLAAGVVPCIKHMPGHGRATADSHKALPQVAEGLEALTEWDFAPFRALNDLPMGMTCHLRFSALDPRPTTASPVMIRLIREAIGFQGLLTTDDITMQALPGTHAQRTAAAIAAGCDVVMHCNGDVAAMAPVVEAAGRLEGPAARRAAAVLAARRPPQPDDLAGLRAELAGIEAARTG